MCLPYWRCLSHCSDCDMTRFSSIFRKHRITLFGNVCESVKSQPKTPSKVCFSISSHRYSFTSNRIWIYMYVMFVAEKKTQKRIQTRNRAMVKQVLLRLCAIISGVVVKLGCIHNTSTSWKECIFRILKHIRRTCYIMFDATHSLNTHTHIRHASYNIAHQTFCAIVRQNGRQRLPSVYDLCNVFPTLVSLSSVLVVVIDIVVALHSFYSFSHSFDSTSFSMFLPFLFLS